MKTVVYNIFGLKNRGDAMLFDALLKSLPDQILAGELCCLALSPDAERSVYSQFRWGERLGHVPRPGALGRLLQLYGLTILAFMAMSRLFLPLKYLLLSNDRHSFEMVRGCDVAISCPGGYLEDSNFAYIVGLINIAILNRYSRVNILAPQSVGPIKSRLGRKICSIVLKGCDKIFARESYSHNFVRNTLGIADVTLTGDMAFLFGKPDEAARIAAREALGDLGVSSDEKLFGLTVVDWKFPAWDDPRAREERYHRLLEGLIEHAQAKGYTVVIFNQVSSDLSLTRQLAARNPGLKIDIVERGATELQAMIAACDLFFGTRFHSCIFALLNGQPIGALAYLPKTSGIMDDLGLADWTFDIADFDEKAVYDHFAYLERARVEGGIRSRESVSAYLGRIQDFSTYMAQLVAPPSAPRT